MPSEELTDAICKVAIGPPRDGPLMVLITWDSEVKGFGLRTTRAGAKAFVLNYRTHDHKQRQYTIGSFPDWNVTKARAQARILRRRIDSGGDPMREKQASREAYAAERAEPTVNDLAALYDRVHLPRKAPISARDDRMNLKKHVLPTLGGKRLSTVTYSDVAALHRKLSENRKVVGNRVLSLMSKMWNVGIKHGMTDTNPCGGVEKVQEVKRERYLTTDEISRLMEVLDKREDQPSFQLIRFCLLTGCRRGEALNATWGQFNLDDGVWIKPAATTKQRKLHRIPLNGSALELLRQIRGQQEARQAAILAEGRIPHALNAVFPGRGGSCLTDVKKAWAAICTEAGIENAHLHDLRHTHASILASSGMSLPVIGQLLGHTQASTTQRYAHLFDETLRDATERVSTLVANAGKNKKVVPLK